MWFACAEYVTQVNNVTAKEALNWSTPMEKGHGYTPDILAYLLFVFWDPVYYLDDEQKYPHSRELSGRFLGVADNVGDALTFHILAANNQLLVCSVV